MSTLSLEPRVVRLGNRKVLMSAWEKDKGILGIGFTPTDEPIWDPKNATAEPTVVIECVDLPAMIALRDMVSAMIEHKKAPSWKLVQSEEKVDE